MLNVNVDNVLYGNPLKGLSIKYSEVVSKNDDESAKAYFDYYRNLPLSAILSSSDLIFKESRYGIKFYTQIIENEFMPFYQYAEQYRKLNDFVNATKDFSDDERNDYNDALTILKQKADACEKALTPFSIEYANNGSDDVDLMNALYHNAFMKDPSVGNKLRDVIKKICSNRIGFILYGPAIFTIVPADAFAIEKLNEYFISNCQGYGDFTSTAYSVILLKLMYQDKMYRDLIESNRNSRFRNLLTDWVDTDPKGMINSVLCSPTKVDNNVINELNESDSDDILESVFNAIEDIDDAEKYDPLYEERVGVKRCILNYYAEALTTILVNNGNYKIDNGILYESSDIDSELKSTDADIAECCNILGIDHSNYSDFTEEDLRKIESNLRTYFEDANTDDEENDDDNSEEDETDEGLPEVSGSTKVKSKLTNAALDIDKKAREAEAKLDERTTATKKLGKAVMAVPNHIRKNIDDATQTAREAKKNKLKRKIMNDGYRSRWWRKIITATKYQMLGSVNILLMPMYWLLRRANRTQNKRLKEDLIKDFKLELTILNDQLEDANREMNSKERERIRREIDKIERELQRVRYNIKAIND